MMFKQILFILILFSLFWAQPSPESTEALHNVEAIGSDFVDEVREEFVITECTVERDPFMLNYFLPAMILSGIMIIALILIYQAGQLLQTQRLSELAKEEGYQLAWTFFLAFFTIAGLLALNAAYDSAFSVQSPYPGQGQIDIIDGAMEYGYQIGTQIATDLSVMFLFSGVVNFFASSTMYFGSFQYAVTISPGLALQPITDIVGLLIQVLSVSMAEWLFHIVTLCFIKKWTFAVFIPLAMLLRAFPPTRDGGGVVLALVWALSLIYPVMFLLNQHMFMLTYPGLDIGGAMITMLESIGWGNVTIGAVALLLLSKTALIPVIIFVLSDIVFMFVTEAIYMFAIMSLLLPFINILVALVAAKEIAKGFLWMEVNYTSIVRVI